MTRDKICKDCPSWKMCPNVDLGVCNFQDKRNTTWYNSRCVWGLVEDIKAPEIEEEKKKNPIQIVSCSRYSDNSLICKECKDIRVCEKVGY